MRLALKKDIEKLVNLRLLQQCEINKYNFDKEKFILETTAYFINHLNKNFFAYLWEEDDVIVGSACLHVFDLIPSLKNKGKTAYICNVYTSSQYRKKGIQRKLLEEIINYGIKIGVTKFELNTSNPVAIKLYQSLGFSNTSSKMSMRIDCVEIH